MAKVFANSEDTDQMPCFAASHLGLHCLPITLLGVSRLQWVKSLYQKATLLLNTEFFFSLFTVIKRIMKKKAYFLGKYENYHLNRACNVFIDILTVNQVAILGRHNLLSN